ncbi:MAG: hypothetical protein KDH96_08990 [Candidatus Riesia sp.]|nr:hypothetical protein [Candidatus Riesia sp.]
MSKNTKSTTAPVAPVAPEQASPFDGVTVLEWDRATAKLRGRFSTALRQGRSILRREGAKDPEKANIAFARSQADALLTDVIESGKTALDEKGVKIREKTACGRKLSDLLESLADEEMRLATASIVSSDQAVSAWVSKADPFADLL